MHSRFFILTVAVLGAGHASAVTHSATDGTIFSTDSLTGFQTNFDDMTGTLVTVTYAGGGIATASFAPTGVDAGAAFNAGNFRVSGTGDTFNANWTLENLSNLSIEQIEFNGRPGNTIWDRTNPSSGTPGSAQGLDLEYVSSTDPNILSANVYVLYSDAIKLNSNAGDPLRDLYSVYTISFQNQAGAPIGLAGGKDFVFRQDADNNRFPGDFVPVIPETSTVVSGLALAALGLVPVARRFRRA